MSGLTERITAVHCAHSVSRVSTIGGHAQQYRCRCEKFTGTWLAWSEHVAERIAEALQLTEETQFVPVARDGSRWAARSREEAYSIPNKPAFDVSDSWIVDHIDAEHRWVSGWTAVEDRP